MTDYTELIKQLRNRRMCIQGLGTLNDYPLLGEAADAIELLWKLYHSAESDHNDMRRAYINEVEKHRSIPAADVRPKWISVEERLPDDGAEVLAWSKSGFAYVDWWIDGAWKVNSLVDGKYEFVTHWMPLPEAPNCGAKMEEDSPIITKASPASLGIYHKDSCDAKD